MKVKIVKRHPEAVIPTYAHVGDMGMDLTALNYDYDITNDCYIYHTGLSVELPKGHGMLVFPRSSNRKTDYYMPNHVGIIDSGYRGEILVCFKHRYTDYRSTIPAPPYKVGERIAQAVILPYPTIEFVEEAELSETERGEGGFGSTGN